MKQGKQYFGALLGTAALLSAAGSTLAQGFVPGDIVVSRLSNGTEPLKSSDLSNDLAVNVFLDQYTPTGALVSSLELTPSASGQNHGIVSSGGSKSEGALTLSTDGQHLTYIGYDAAAAPVGFANPSSTFSSAGNAPAKSPPPFVNRVIASIDSHGAIDTTTALTDVSSGDNPRAVVSTDGQHFYSAGNASKKEIGTLGTHYSTLGATTSTLLGTVGSSPSKADNIRGIGIYNGDLFVSKGSGGTGANGIFQVGSGLPTTGATGNVKELPGFPTVNPGDPGQDPTQGLHSFGFFFANSSTLYVADEGLENQVLTAADATPTAHAGLQKWTLNNGTWTLQYTLKDGLNLGGAETINGVTTYTEGLRSLAGRVNKDGTVSFYSVTAQTDANANAGDANPDKLVSVTDTLSSLTGAGESFKVVAESAPGELFRGVAFAPAPEPSGVVAFLICFSSLGVGAVRRRLKGPRN